MVIWQIESILKKYCNRPTFVDKNQLIVSMKKKYL